MTAGDDAGTPPLRRAVLAGHRRDEAGARRLLDDPSPAVRAAALSALARMHAVTDDDVTAALSDPDPLVRRRACELAASDHRVDLRPMLADGDPAVVEAAAWALGERGAAADDAVPPLSAVARRHEDPLCREAAVAALGSIGDPGALHAVLAATGDRAPVRRRAVIALAAFDGPEVEAALQRALDDKDWQVRQAAEDLVAGPSEPPTAPPP